MKVIVGNQVFNSEEEPITIVWDTDKERIASGKIISGMLAGALPPRAYMSYPKSITPEMAIRLWDQIKKKYYGSNNEQNGLEHSISG